MSQTHDLNEPRAAMGRALEWHHHLFAAEAFGAADDIANIVWYILYRWGQPDRARALLRHSITTLEGFRKAIAQANMASILMNDGKLDEALATHEAVYQTFEALNARQQMAVVLGRISQVYQHKGEIDQSITKQSAALQLERQIGDERGRAISLHQLSMLYMLREDNSTALAHGEEAATLARKLGDDYILAGSLHQQGLIHNSLAHTAQSEEECRTHLLAAIEHFQSSWEIARRIGDEAGAAITLFELGKLLLDSGRLQEAMSAFTGTLATYERLGMPAYIGTALEALGVVHERQGEYEAALEKYQQALQVLQQYGSPQQQAITERNIAQVQARLRGAG